MQNISITKTKRSVPKLTHSTYPVIIRKGKEWIKDDHGGYVEVSKLKEAEVNFVRQGVDYD
ncbi:hypothetical protein JR317_gp200 [Escherichia phage vB_EcoM_PHB05]|uniref:Uncharacterized protein n=6 Tax=Justusliebigvirus TaxID=2948775 RepID=A0A291LAF4_9CAUD|nr:hypothetical protein JR317_gp200 [Escherichia phage vB_EcoM_PHB05]ATI15942.1 hypothetical protein [Escherichia phage vB_EcoM_PHB05]